MFNKFAKTLTIPSEEESLPGRSKSLEIASTHFVLGAPTQEPFGEDIAMAIFGAEVVMRWLPKGTHDWAKFITPDELYDLLQEAGLEPVDRKGFVFNPISWSWRISDRDLSVNYVTASVSPQA